LTYVLDTNIFIAGLNGNAKVLQRLDALNPDLSPSG
jgi:predicted nucleic acid-binding protein